MVRRGVRAVEDKEHSTGPSKEPAPEEDDLISSPEEPKREEQEAPLYLSLGSVRSEYQKLCDELGGPAEGVTPMATKSNFKRCCNEYSLGRILPLLLRFNEDRDIARRHWPHAAVAISQYVFAIKERDNYVEDEPTPAKVEKLLSQIAQSASELTAGLCRLQTIANRLDDPNGPNRRGHLRWIDLFISQAAAGLLSNDVDETPQHRLLVMSRKLDFIQRLAEIEGTTRRAIERTDKALLERERGPSNPALPKFVRLGSSIWTSLTERNPTAEKLVRTSGSEDPAFVLFMQGLARVARAREPNRNEIALCLKRLTPTTTT